MIADEQRIFHGTGGNFKRLQDEGNDEESGDKHARQRSEKLDRRFGWLLVFYRFFRVFFRHCVLQSF